MADLFPLDTAIPIVEVDSKGATKGLVTFNFLTRWNDLVKRLQSAAYNVAPPVALSDQHASIVATPVTTATLAAGLYRVSWYARVTTPDGVSSSLTVTLGWTEGSQALTLSGVAITGDAVTSVQSGMAFLRIDNGSPITYATTYASNTPNKMRYELTVNLERVA